MTFRRLATSATSCCAIILATAMLAAPAMARQGAFATPAEASVRAPVGLWLTANGKAVVRIADCGDELCGRIAGLSRAPSEAMPTDLAGHPQCGLTIIHAEGPHGNGVWTGTVSDPRTGRSYGARLRVDEAGNLRLRGFLGIPLLGETVTWHAFRGRLATACRMS